jgi:hypothetical protein
MMKAVLCALSVLATAAPLLADGTNTADLVMAAVLSRRPSKDLELRAKLYVTREKFVPVELLVKNLTAETRTLYKAEGLELLVTQPVTGDPRFYLRGKGEVTGNARLQKLLGSEFTFYDLGLPFLHWPQRKLVGIETFRGRDCQIIECVASNQPYAQVKLWVDQEYQAFLRAEMRNAEGDVVRRILITSFKRVGEMWVPRGIDCAFLPPNQSLPAAEKSRLEIYTGNYDAKLPAETFDPSRF